MSTRVQWLGHACLLIESGGLQVLIDPFLTGNPKAAAQADTLKPDVILVSHGHEDHVGDTIAIAKASGATVVANYELGEWFQKEGLTKVHGMQHGGGHQVHPGLYVKLTLAFHGSTLPGGGYGCCRNAAARSTGAARATAAAISDARIQCRRSASA